MIIGLFAGGRWHVVSLYLIVAALTAFLMRQPIAVMTKAYSGRLPRELLPAARFWLLLYGSIAVLHIVGLVLRGYGYVLFLGIPAMPILVWYLWLVARRAERKKWQVETLAVGALALTAPAAMWVGKGAPDPAGWLLWLLLWTESVTAIAYVYLRLSLRELESQPTWKARLRLGSAPLVTSLGAVVIVLWLGQIDLVGKWLWLPFAIQAAEVLGGVAKPRHGARPTEIGYRQLGVTTLFTILFIATWSR